MNLWTVPWLEAAVVVPVLGALWVNRFRDAVAAFRWGLAFTGATLACALLAWLRFHFGPAEGGWSMQPRLFGGQPFALDVVNAPLIPLVALLHFLTALATGRTKMRRFSLSWSLAAEAVRLAGFACTDPWLLVGLLVAGTVPGYVELRNRRQPTRVYVVHMALFV